MPKTELITDTQTLVSAHYGSRGQYEIPIYDDGYGPLWISRNSIGINGIVRAKTWEDAYSICEDEFFPEADETLEEIVKEYGFKREHVKVVKDASVLVASEHCGVGERFETMDDYRPTLVPKFVRWVTIETPDADAWADNELFQEGFGFRPNGPNKNDKLNHGIYSKDLNGDYLDPLTPEMIEEIGITLEITADCLSCGETRNVDDIKTCPDCGESVCNDCTESHKWEDHGLREYRDSQSETK